MRLHLASLILAILFNITVKAAVPTEACLNEVVAKPCGPNEEFYRTIDGRCNNKEKGKTLYGAAHTPFKRIIDTQLFVGYYENHEYDKNGKNAYHYVRITYDNKENKFTWTNDNGDKWILHPLDETSLSVDPKDNPYYKGRKGYDGWKVAKFTEEDVKGPGMEVYKRESCIDRNPNCNQQSCTDIVVKGDCAFTCRLCNAELFVGYYENHEYDNGGKNNYHYVTITYDKNKKLYTWTNEDGVRWKMMPRDRNSLSVDSTNPYYRRGFTVVVFENDHLKGPDGEVYKREPCIDRDGPKCTQQSCTDMFEKGRCAFTCNLCNSPTIECPTQNTESYKARLPTAQEVSDRIFQMTDDEPNDSAETTSLQTYFGQFLDHDITLTENAELHCDGADTCDNTCFEDLKCAIYDKSTPNTSPRKCYSFTRSTRSCTSTVTLRRQLNSITSFIDGSQIYGSDDTLSGLLREHKNGLLKVKTNERNEDMLPENPSSAHPCKDRGGCFFAGDARSNEHIALTSLHTLFVREHNKIARELLARPGMANEDQKIFSEARRIVGALLQNFVYKEYLPLLGVELQDFDKYSYSPNVDPSIVLEFNTAAYRFGHSQVKHSFKIKHANKPAEYIPLRRTFFNTTDVRNSGITAILTGLVDESSEVVDTKFAEDLGEHLFIPEDDPHGKQNLAALNIQRGRDHNLAGYQSYFERYHHNVPDYDSLFPSGVPDKLRDVYGSNMDSIDLFAAGMAEKSYSTTPLGPTFRNIIEEQFAKLRDGDRFFYRNHFSDEAIKEIESIHFSSIFCRNLKISKIQKYVMKKRNNVDNHELNCDGQIKTSYDYDKLIQPPIPVSSHGPKLHTGPQQLQPRHDNYHKDFNFHPRNGNN